MMAAVLFKIMEVIKVKLYIVFNKIEIVCLAVFVG